jgi:hypothetical protein
MGRRYLNPILYDLCCEINAIAKHDLLEGAREHVEFYTGVRKHGEGIANLLSRDNLLNRVDRDVGAAPIGS